MELPTLEQVAAMTPEEVIKTFGLDKKAESIIAGAKEVLELEGEAKKVAERKWQDRIQPKVDDYDFRWIKEDAIRETQDPKEVLDSPSPASVMD